MAKIARDRTRTEQPIGAVTQFANVLINNERRALRFLNAEEEFQPRERRERECEAPADPAPAAKKARTEPAK